MASPGPSRRGILLGLAAAVSFGISAPFAKRLLDDVRPEMLAGLLYLGAFVALSGVRRQPRREAHLQRADVPRLVALVVLGGVLAPVALMLGLERVSGVTGSLLLNLEGAFTIAVGVAVFREHLSRVAVVGAVAIFAGAVFLGGESGSIRGDWVGVGLVAAACAAWSIDNNLTQSLTLRDPVVIVRVKTGVAGTINVLMALVVGEAVPKWSIVVTVLALGAFSYGFSVFLDALALRSLGAAREAAVFAVAPFVGALVSPLVLSESLAGEQVAAGALMAVGLTLLLRERHEHVHRHEPVDHEHRHVHDAHHQHPHDPSVPPDESHSHRHHHEALTHSHGHVSDSHHRHSHREAG
jgi:drug/metabolite transporter (DMT)-like permease